MDIDLIYLIVLAVASVFNTLLNVITSYKNGRLRSEIRHLDPDKIEKLKRLKENYENLKEQIKNGRN